MTDLYLSLSSFIYKMGVFMTTLEHRGETLRSFLVVVILGPGQEKADPQKCAAVAHLLTHAARLSTFSAAAHAAPGAVGSKDVLALKQLRLKAPGDGRQPGRSHTRFLKTRKQSLHRHLDGWTKCRLISPDKMLRCADLFSQSHSPRKEPAAVQGKSVSTPKENFSS